MRQQTSGHGESSGSSSKTADLGQDLDIERNGQQVIFQNGQGLEWQWPHLTGNGPFCHCQNSLNREEWTQDRSGA